MRFFLRFRRGQAKKLEIFAARISKIFGKQLGSRFPCSLSRFSFLGWCSGCCLWRHRLLLDALASMWRAIPLAAKFWGERLSPKFWVGRHWPGTNDARLVSLGVVGTYVIRRARWRRHHQDHEGRERATCNALCLCLHLLVRPYITEKKKKFWKIWLPHLPQTLLGIPWLNIYIYIYIYLALSLSLFSLSLALCPLSLSLSISPPFAGGVLQGVGCGHPYKWEEVSLAKEWQRPPQSLKSIIVLKTRASSLCSTIQMLVEISMLKHWAETAQHIEQVWHLPRIIIQAYCGNKQMYWTYWAYPLLQALHNLGTFRCRGRHVDSVIVRVSLSACLRSPTCTFLSTLLKVQRCQKQGKGQSRRYNFNRAP